MTDHREEAYCTLLLSDDYLPGAMVLAHSLRDAYTRKKLVVIITPDTLDPTTIEQLKTIYDQIIPVPRIINQLPANLFLMNRPDLHSTFTKINLWRLQQYRKIVYLDADVVALRAPDELFDIESTFAAAPDIGWPDCFNSGVLVLNPNMGDYYALLALAQRGISFDGADQGLLNMHFRDFHRLSFAYNCTPSGNYQYAPAYRHFQSSISIVHYIAKDKPWRLGRDMTGRAPIYEELLGRWWAVYDRHYRAPANRTLQRFVAGEDLHTEPISVLPPTSTPQAEPEKPTTSRRRQDSLHETDTSPVKRGFTALHSSWDPSTTAPPLNSQPEAINLPQTTYHMSQDTTLFKTTSPFPAPPKDLSYELPKTLTGSRPRPIFPWEATAPKPTRVFDETPRSRAESVTTTSTVTEGETRHSDTTPATPTIPVTPSEPWKTFTAGNAWDEMPEINYYISNVFQQRKAKSTEELAIEGGDVLSPTTGTRRPSLKLTDFPTEIERPSLPVTPAAVRRPSFWGAQRDADGELPAAEGVPKQEDWDPTSKLEELSHHQSAVLPHTMSLAIAPSDDPELPSDSKSSPTTTRAIPDRALPESAVPVPTSPPQKPSPTTIRRESSRRESGPPPANPNFTPGGIGQETPGQSSVQAGASASTNANQIAAARG